jgi:hypothetical protein
VTGTADLALGTLDWRRDAVAAPRKAATSIMAARTMA